MSPSSGAPHGVPAASDRALFVSIPSICRAHWSESSARPEQLFGCQSCAMHGKGSAAAGPALRPLAAGRRPSRTLLGSYRMLKKAAEGAAGHWVTGGRSAASGAAAAPVTPPCPKHCHCCSLVRKMLQDQYVLSYVPGSVIL